MKDRKNWSSELKLEEVSAGLETVKEQLNERVVCLHTDSRYGVPDAITSYLIQNFNDLGIKKLIITSFPIPEDAEEWTELLVEKSMLLTKFRQSLQKKLTACPLLWNIFFQIIGKHLKSRTTAVRQLISE